MALILNYDDLRNAAKRRLPKIAFDFIEGGLDDEVGIDRNRWGFERHRIVPRYMVDVTKREQKTELFGRTYSQPVGIAPTGGAALFRPGADMMLAAAARKANVPFIMSGASTDTIENLARVAPEHGWYQMYPAKDKTISYDMIRRCKDAGLSTLVVTVDVPVHSNRERNKRNGMSRPLRMPLRTKLEALLHPGWMLDYYRNIGGTPMLSNWAQYAGPGAEKDSEKVATFQATQTTPPLDWNDIAKFRELWPGKFVLKGVMHPADAERAVKTGVDGLMISNHGARQLDRAPSPVEVLPAIRDAVGDKLTLMLDSGIRRGSDVVTAFCLGAKYCFVGRMTLYGVAIGGEAMAGHALGILKNEVDLVMGNMGAPDIRSLGPDFLMWDDEADLRRNTRP
ncbi:MAG: alpha-hydroxy-acid oxidizing protein [Proteobacteria bacterium]|nr:alpha-hydroxy-acid oxidizing protein [Pseudomonadota bacterium]